MWLLWHTKKSFSNKLSSTSSSKADLHIEKAKAASQETRQFGIHDQLKVELKKEDSKTFLKSIVRSVVFSGNNIPGTGSLWIQP